MITYTLDYILFERSPSLLVILAAVAWFVFMDRALKVFVLRPLAQIRERRQYEREAATAEQATVITLPVRRPRPRKDAA